MRHIHEEYGSLFDGSDARADGQPTDTENYLLWKMEHFADENLKWRQRNPGAPLLYDTDVVYDLPEQLKRAVSDKAKAQVASILRKDGVSESKIRSTLDFLDGVETFYDTPRLYEEGKGDCNILVPTRMAELRAVGIPAKAVLVKKPGPDGVSYYHAQLEVPPMAGIAEVYGVPQPSIEDPSVILGMAGVGPEMREEMRRNVERVQAMCGNAAAILGCYGGDGPVAGHRIQMCGFVPIMQDRLQRWIEFSSDRSLAS